MGLVVLSKKDLLALVDQTIARTGISPTELGVLLLADPGLIRGLRRGRSPRLETCAKIVKGCEDLIEKAKYRRKRMAEQRLHLRQQEV